MLHHYDSVIIFQEISADIIKLFYRSVIFLVYVENYI